jgi:hypothetical protein
MLSEAAQRNQQLQELTRFLHYYTRFRNHENSQHLEAPLLGAVHHKMELLAASLCKTQAKSGQFFSTLVPLLTYTRIHNNIIRINS